MIQNYLQILLSAQSISVPTLTKPFKSSSHFEYPTICVGIY